MSGADETKLPGFRPRRDLPPFVIAVLILAFIIRGKDWDQVFAALANVDQARFILGAGGYIACYFVITAVSYWLVYNFFGAGVRLRPMAVAFGASLLPQAVFPLLGQGLFLLYMVKHQRVPLWRALGNHLFIAYCDLWVMAAVVGLALILLPDPPALFVLWFSALAPALIAAWWYARHSGGRLFPWLHQSEPLRALRTGSARQYAGFIGLRLVWQALQILFHLVTLSAIGIVAPVGMVGVLVMLMALTSLLPIAALGYGGPNLVAEFFSPWVAPGQAPAETAFAYGLLFQTCFLLGRLLIGTALALPMWRSLADRKS